MQGNSTFQTDVQDSCTYELIVYTRTVQEEAKSNSGLDRELGVKFSLSQGAIFSWYLLVDEESKVKIYYQAAEDRGNDSLKNSHGITLDKFLKMYYMQPNHALQSCLVRCQALPDNWLHELQVMNDFWEGEFAFLRINLPNLVK